MNDGSAWRFPPRLRGGIGWGPRAERAKKEPHPALPEDGEGEVTLLLALVIVVHLEQRAAALRFERSVINAGRTARIGRRDERLAALALRIVADDEVAGHQVDLLPVVVDEGRGRIDAGIEFEQARAAAHLLCLVEVARKN